ncbi:putative methyl transferase [Desulfamplus magnetovallimortis]|uniref:Putative methyl transferase n=1 Tax=Desulfamplus magnetovallimortis TaxID=1246637 RepID=A0A1W1HBY1_9BACT|nr:class I SAM-dependent methyltransferase [Desulfamplus magnetovallimortis]SLM29946.1 putative methyl transferase [Desulfamplus magnetovallimortis]
MEHNNEVLDTIEDFGKQWQEYTENTGFYGSLSALESLIEPLLNISDISNSKIADVGAGTGRYALMFHQAGADKIVALEPSDAFSVLQKNTEEINSIECFKKRADEIPYAGFDYVFCIGVLQFIPDPAPALVAMGRALNNRGRIFLWVYGQENNRLYLSFVLPLRKITTRLPHAALKALTLTLLPIAEIYALAGRFLKLPLSEYLSKYFLKVDRYTRRVIIHDQLNPSYVRYYGKNELKALLEKCGFEDIRMHHRMGYSWSVTARYAGN